MNGGRVLKCNLGSGRGSVARHGSEGSTDVAVRPEPDINLYTVAKLAGLVAEASKRLRQQPERFERGDREAQHPAYELES
jgi:hypothetical protein